MTDYQPTVFFRELTARVRGHLARFDISQADLAVLCGVSQSQFSKILRGVRPMTIDQLATICDATELNMERLISDVERFVSEREARPSPLKFVEDQERLDPPYRWSDNMLDPWGIAAAARLDVTSGSESVGGQGDYGLVARPAEKEPTDEQ